MKLCQMTFVFIFFISVLVQANTFVGNGGNAGDVELQVTLSQVKKSLAEVVQKKSEAANLCTCDESMQGHKICEGLKALSLEQKNYCEKTLADQAQEMLNAINGRSGLQIIWTSEAMNVSESTGLREAIGVTQPVDKKIFINREDFLDLRDYERIYLVTHELGHLVKIENKYLRDDEKIGPFKQTDGGRQLLNSMGAAIAMKSLTNGGVDDYKGSLRRSKSYKRNWFQMSVGTESQRNDQSAFAIKNYSGGNASYRFQITQEIGITAGARYLKGSETFLSIVKAESELKLYHVQMNYRLFPFNNPLSFWGQSHLLLGAGYEFGTAEMKLDDTFVAVTEKANLSAPLFSMQYYLPLFVGIWFHGGVNLSTHQYEFKKIVFKSQENQTYFNLGVSYAF